MIKVVTWQYVKPGGAHFIFVRIDRIALSPNRPFPEYVSLKSRNYQVYWYLIQEYGDSSIPGSGTFQSN